MDNIFKSKQFWRYGTYLLYIFCALVVPVIIIAEKYGIFYKASQLRFTGWGIIILIITLFFIRKEIVKTINSMQAGLFKGILQGIIHMIPLALLNVVLLFAKAEINTIQYIVVWSTVSNVIACIFEAIHQKLLFEINTDRQATALADRINGG